MHRKLPSRLEPKAPTSTAPRALSPATATGAPVQVPAYAAILAAARSQALRALLVIAPLGALAGTVTACGAAAPVRPDPYHQYDPTRPREATSAVPPPATSSSAASPHEVPQKPQAM